MLTKIALATALALSAASAALANDSGENHQDNDRSVVSGGVASASYGYAAPSAHRKNTVHEQTQSR